MSNLCVFLLNYPKVALLFFFISVVLASFLKLVPLNLFLGLIQQLSKSKALIGKSLQLSLQLKDICCFLVFLEPVHLSLLLLI